MTTDQPSPVQHYYHLAMVTDKEDYHGKLSRNLVFCLPGYSPKDHYDPSRGCYPNEVKDFCDPNSSPSDVSILRIANADFPNREFSELERVFQLDEEICRHELLNDCLCEAAVFSGVTVCAILAPLFASIAIYYHPFVRKYRHAKNPRKRKPIELNLRAFSFQQLHEATNGFKNKLGQRASGAVYRGSLKLEDKEVEVAIKQLENVTEQGEEDKEFLAEVRVIGLTHHKNLVRLLGFRNEKNHRLLVYELMKNGAVSNFIFRDVQRPSWKLTSNIVLGIAKGVLYMHEECENQIIHCDIKPQNVLLDKNYTAKIADFGLAKLCIRPKSENSISRSEWNPGLEFGVARSKDQI
ncbi:PREDICTED: G-type lectin S-receptor-like serine/threonine-protein kinase LECRK4 [Nicotiana attenuata]|uniref:G-type lectin S-receptor-like serine/threonine-protein kinase LECRK4 n=1 Tax=Nicotiana attenuata TaxID=49451 RepID=UPI0009046277|nr:PREDICTED: G-type lectin S-receptor-like serine/threonine-protein kinase LECRK4 [Nicotiana attenuata]